MACFRIEGTIKKNRLATRDSVEALASARGQRSVIGLLMLVLFSEAASGQLPEAAQRAVRATVMIRADFGSASKIGAGLILGQHDERIYVATANHLVRWGDTAASEVTLALSWARDHFIAARVEAGHDAALDLAVLSFYDPEEVIESSVDFEVLGEPRLLKRGAAVYTLGYPNGSPWRLAASPDSVVVLESEGISFESPLVFTGHSGGPLLDRHFRVVGLIRSDVAPDAEAARIDSVLRRLKSLQYPINLKLSSLLNEDAEISSQIEEYPVVVVSRDPWINNKKLGEMKTNRSTITIRIGEELDYRYLLSTRFEDKTVRLAAGTHAFEFEADIDLYYARDATGTCSGLLTVDGPKFFHPYIRFNKRGNIVQCDLFEGKSLKGKALR